MDQLELDQSVARATGESLATIAALGFSVLVEPPPLVIVDRRTRLRDLTRTHHQHPARKSPARPSPDRRNRQRRNKAGQPYGHGLIMPMPMTLPFDKRGA